MDLDLRKNWSKSNYASKDSLKDLLDIIYSFHSLWKEPIHDTTYIYIWKHSFHVMVKVVGNILFIYLFEYFSKEHLKDENPWLS